MNRAQGVCIAEDRDRKGDSLWVQTDRLSTEELRFVQGTETSIVRFLKLMDESDYLRDMLLLRRGRVYLLGLVGGE